jgi:voltage-gated potassium channel
MTAPNGSVAAPDGFRRTWEDRLAGPMFFVAGLFLVVLAGLIHRYPHLKPHDPEAYLIEGGLVVLWLAILAEAWLRFRLRDRGRPAWKALLGAAVCGLLPPLRLGCRSQMRANHIWLPGLGWHEINRHLRLTLERAFSVPMVCFALLVLPLLALEHFEAETIRSEPVLALWLDIGTSVIWLAFAVELILMVAVADRPWRYCVLHWIDVAIVLLPAVGMLPLFRLLRVGRVLRLEQLLRWGRVHRLQSLVARCWRAVLILQIVQRLTGRSAERRLQDLRELRQAKEEELADLGREIRELEERMAQKALRRKTAAPPETLAAPPDEAARLGSPALT